jgi:hypothetical protein
VRVWRAGPGTGRDRTGQDGFESLLTMLVATKGEERLPGTGTPLPYQGTVRVRVAIRPRRRREAKVARVMRMSRIGGRTSGFP